MEDNYGGQFMEGKLWKTKLWQIMEEKCDGKLWSTIMEEKIWKLNYGRQNYGN